MNDREFFCQRHQAEFPTFNRVLDALPLTQFTYRPHDRAPSTLDLVWTLANEMAACSTIIDRGEVHWTDVPAPGAADPLRRSTPTTRRSTIVCRRSKTSSGRVHRSSTWVRSFSWN